jgi:hypothetical protein
MADHNKPVLTSTYANFVSELDARFDDLSLGLDPAVTTATNLPVNSLRWNSALGKDQKWNGTVWSDKSSFYALGIVRFNNGTAAAPSITFNDDVTTGISKPTASTLAISTAGVQQASFSSTGMSLVSNLSFTGTGNRITGDFSNATPNNRVMFQSSVTNGDTTLGVIPNGASTTSQVDVYSSNNLVNSSLGQIVATASDIRLVSGIIGTGTYLPLRLFTSGIQRMQIDTSGNSSFQGAVSSASFTTSGNLSFTGTGNRITGDFSNATLGNRLFFQTSTINSSSEVSVMPNGTGNGSGFRSYSLLDVLNSPTASIQSTSTEVVVESSRTGTGSYLPLVVRTGGAEAFRVNTNQTISGLRVTEINGGQLAGNRNKLINGNFGINQRVVSGTVVLTAGQYGHDYWKAGAGGCTYTFSTVNNVTTITITVGSLTQIINGKNLFSGTHVLSWVGTAQGRVGASAYGASGLTASVTGGANTTVEFGTGTLSFAQFELGSTPTIFEFRLNELQLCETRCCKSYDQGVAPGTANATGAVGVTAMGSCNYAAIPVKFPVTMEGVPTVTIYGAGDGIAGRITKDATWIAGAAVQIGQGGCLIRASNQPATTDNFLSAHFLAVAGL